MGYQDFEAIRRLTDHTTRLRQMVDEALRPMGGLMAIERQMTARFPEMQASFQFPWERMMAEFERSLPTFRPPDLSGLLPVVAEPIRPPALDFPSPAIVPLASRLEELESAQARTDARVEQLENLIWPPSPPEEGEDTGLKTGQYL